MLVTPKKGGLQTLVYASLCSPGREERYSRSQCGLERSFLAVTCLSHQERTHRLVVSNPNRRRDSQSRNDIVKVVESVDD